MSSRGWTRPSCSAGPALSQDDNGAWRPCSTSYQTWQPSPLGTKAPDSHLGAQLPGTPDFPTFQNSCPHMQSGVCWTFSILFSDTLRLSRDCSPAPQYLKMSNKINNFPSITTTRYALTPELQHNFTCTQSLPPAYEPQSKTLESMGLFDGSPTPIEETTPGLPDPRSQVAVLSKTSNKTNFKSLKAYFFFSLINKGNMYF